MNKSKIEAFRKLLTNIKSDLFDTILFELKNIKEKTFFKDVKNML